MVLADIDGPAAEKAAAEIQQATSSKCTGGPSECFTTACPGSLPLLLLVLPPSQLLWSWGKACLQAALPSSQLLIPWGEARLQAAPPSSQLLIPWGEARLQAALCSGLGDCCYS